MKKSLNEKNLGLDLGEPEADELAAEDDFFG